MMNIRTFVLGLVLAVGALTYAQDVHTVVQTGHRIKDYDVSGDGQYAVTSDGKSVALWDLHRRRIIREMALDNAEVRIDGLHPGHFFMLDFDRAVSMDKDKYYDTYDIMSGERVGMRRGAWLSRRKPYTADAFLSLGNDGRLHIMPYSTKREVGVLDGAPTPMFDRKKHGATVKLAVTDGDSLLYVGGEVPRVWDLRKLTIAPTAPVATKVSIDKVKGNADYKNAVKAMSAKMKARNPELKMPETLDVVWDVTPETTDGTYYVAHDAGGVGRYSKGRYDVIKEFDVPVTAVAADGKTLLVGTELGGLYSYDLANPSKDVKYEIGEASAGRGVNGARVGAVQLLPGGYIASGTSRNTLLFHKLGNPKTVATSDIHTAEVIDIVVGEGGKRFYSVDQKGHVVVWDGATLKPIVNIYPIGESDYVFLTPDNYYTGTRSLADYVHFSRGLDVYGFDQYDLTLNRPDIVMERMGAPADVVAAYHKAWQKRVKKMGFTPEQLLTELHAPEVTVGELPLTTTKSTVTLHIEASDSKYQLDKLMVSINGVPVLGRYGRDIRGKSQVVDLPLELATGNNVIHVSAINDRGVESHKAEAQIWYENPSPKSDVYVAVVGVSDYANGAFNLNYASKDAADFLALVEGHANVGGKVNKLVLTDGEVTLGNLAKICEFFGRAGRDDIAILYYAGHGLLDGNMDYFLATHDVDFNNPSERGWSYDAFEDVIDGIDPIRKFCFIDACHSGELDKDDFIAENTQKVDGKTIAFRAAGAGVRAKSAGVAATRALVNDLFIDFRYGTGATVLSSSDGGEVSIEDGGVGNGLFTYAIKRAVLDGLADRDGDHSTTMSELSDYVSREVKTLSGGAQTPGMRLQNRQSDWVIFR